jgi:hypothetical protein
MYAAHAFWVGKCRGDLEGYLKKMVGHLGDPLAEMKAYVKVMRFDFSGFDSATSAAKAFHSSCLPFFDDAFSPLKALIYSYMAPHPVATQLRMQKEADLVFKDHDGDVSASIWRFSETTSELDV